MTQAEMDLTNQQTNELREIIEGSNTEILGKIDKLAEKFLK